MELDTRGPNTETFARLHPLEYDVSGTYMREHDDYAFFMAYFEGFGRRGGTLFYH